MGEKPRNAPDSLMVGRKIRFLREGRGMTLADLGILIERAPSQVSMIENGHREPKASQLMLLAEVLGTTVEYLLDPEPPSTRVALEVELERAERGHVFSALGIPPVRVAKSLPTDALQVIVGLQREIERLHVERAATLEEARRANTELRATMKAKGNHFPELELEAQRLLQGIGHNGGPLSQQGAADLAKHLGFTLHHVPDLPHSTRSVTDLRNSRIYVPTGSRSSKDPRSFVLQALADHVLGHQTPTDYADFLHQRVESNYLSAALMVPEKNAVPLLQAAKDSRQISIEDLRDAFSVSYETAAHRFTNLATRHLGLQVHFMKVHESGIFHKAYENDGLQFPTDILGAVEGQPACRHWTARTVFGAEDRLTPFSQYADTSRGTYWCTSRVQASTDGEFSVSVGVRFEDVKWFRGRETTLRTVSKCPDENCCRRPSGDLLDRWDGYVWTSARPHASMLAAMPTGAFPGVDATEVFTFLDSHAPGRQD